MSVRLQCSNGHRWEAAADAAPASADAVTVCPQCGSGSLVDDAVAGDPGTHRHSDAHAATAVLSAEESAHLADDAGSAPTLIPQPSVAEVAWPQLPGYTILGPLGRGGMGVVYRARQDSLGREVALKMILSGIHASAEELQRFRTEAESAARLQHPNIVQVYEVGQADGRPYCALEFVDGRTLSHTLGGKPQPPREAAVLLCTLAEAVACAHRSGIVHRDLKPENVLIARDGTPKITDFGLAKQLDGNTPATTTGHIMGTPAYMAPEQAGGVTRHIGPPCDVYSLGVMLYEMLTGHPPLVGHDSMDTLRRVLAEDPVAVRRLQPRVPRDLETICHKCLDKNPRRRYADAGELAADLTRYLNHEPILARPVGRGEKAVKWARRHPARALAATVAVLLPLLLVAGFAWHYQRLSQEFQRTEAQRQRAESDLAHFQDWVDEILEQVADQQLPTSPAHDALRRKLLSGTLATCQSLLVQNPQHPGLRWRTGRAQRQTARILHLLGDYPQAEQQYQQSIDILELLVAEHPRTADYRRDLASAYNNLGNLYNAMARHDRIEPAYRRALAEFQQLRAIAPDDPRAAWQEVVVRTNLGIVLARTGRAGDAETLYRAALADAEALHGAHPEATEHLQSLAAASNNLGTLLKSQGRLADAREALARACELYDTLHSADPQSAETAAVLATTRNNLAAVEQQLGNPSAAVAHYALGIALLDRLHEDFPTIREFTEKLAVAHNNRGLMLASEGDFASARESFARALDLLEPLPDDTNPLRDEALATSLQSLAMLEQDDGRLDQAEKYLTQALERRERLASRFVDDALHQNNLALALGAAGELMLARGNFKAARYYLTAALEAERRAMELDDSSEAFKLALRNQYAALAETLLKVGEPGAAAEAVHQLADALPGSAEGHRRAAELMAQCITVAQMLKSADVDTEQLARDAMGYLKRAHAGGAIDADTLRQGDVWKPLRQRDDFSIILAPPIP